MATDLLNKIPDRLKSLWHMENELRNAALNGLIVRKDEASATSPRRGGISSRP